MHRAYRVGAENRHEIVLRRGRRRVGHEPHERAVGIHAHGLAVHRERRVSVAHGPQHVRRVARRDERVGRRVHHADAERSGHERDGRKRRHRLPAGRRARAGFGGRAGRASAARPESAPPGAGGGTGTMAGAHAATRTAAASAGRGANRGIAGTYGRRTREGSDGGAALRAVGGSLTPYSTRPIFARHGAFPYGADDVTACSFRGREERRGSSLLDSIVESP